MSTTPEAKTPEAKASEAKVAVPSPVSAPVVAQAPAPKPLKEGETVLLTAVYGRIVHPYQVPLEFNQGEYTKVKVDDWVVTQFNAGKLARAE